jgi:hypothetical protein
MVRCILSLGQLRITALIRKAIQPVSGTMGLSGGVSDLRAGESGLWCDSLVCRVNSGQSPPGYWRRGASFWRNPDYRGYCAVETPSDVSGHVGGHVCAC